MAARTPLGLLQKSSSFAEILTPFETMLLQIHTASILRLPSSEISYGKDFGAAVFLSKDSFQVELSHAFYL